MLRIRPEISTLKPYGGGASVEELFRRYGLRDIIKLGTNESPLPPFSEVQQVIAEAASGINRYPDADSVDLRAALAGVWDVPPECIWLGAGSSELLTTTARALGGEGRSFVYPWPSFAMYWINSLLANAESITVDLDERLGIDLEATRRAIRDDTTMVCICNPNNPTGSYLPQSAIRAFIDETPEDTLVVVDEAYGEYVTAEENSTAIPIAIERGNVVVARTFSKVYGLAGLRVGYMVGRPDTLRSLRKAQNPFVVSSLAQVAATASLRYPERVAERLELNRHGVGYLEDAYSARGIEYVPTQANFIWTRLGPGAPDIIEALLARGTIIRSGDREWARVTIGTLEENRRFVNDLDHVLTGS